MERYIAFDVETPNSANDRISSIGIAVIENGKITDEFYTLVNPGTYFHRFNVALTGITPDMVEDKPEFPELWEMIEPIMDSGVLIAHNAPFDMSVIAKCLHDYNIHWKFTADYACTVQMTRRLLPDLPDHRLDTMCGYYGIDLSHHNAGSDSRACGELLLRCIDAGLDVSRFIRKYDILKMRTVK